MQALVIEVTLEHHRGHLTVLIELLIVVFGQGVVRCHVYSCSNSAVVGSCMAFSCLALQIICHSCFTMGRES